MTQGRILRFQSGPKGSQVDAFLLKILQSEFAIRRVYQYEFSVMSCHMFCPRHLRCVTMVGGNLPIKVMGN